MKKLNQRFTKADAARAANRIVGGAGTLLVCLVLISQAGCSTARSKSEAAKFHERGWIGGEFKLARKYSLGALFHGSETAIWTFPRDLAGSNRAGILITALGSNAPTRDAGLLAGDLIIACNNQPVTTLQSFRQLVGRSEPGTSLALAAWRDGRTFDANVVVGREIYTNWGAFTVRLPLSPKILKSVTFDLWPDPSFSLLVLGFKPGSGDHQELGSVEGAYARACNGGNYHPRYRDWDAWLAVFSLERGGEIVSQESVPARTNAPPPGDSNRL